MKIFADEDFSKAEISLVNSELWSSFHAIGTEMIITKTGRRMFPSLQLQISGLDPSAHYSLLVEFALASPHKYKYKTSWEPVGDAERHMASPQARLYTHPHGRALGSFWMGQTLHLNKIKLANAFVEGTILLNSMHKYIPRIHLIKQSPHQQQYHYETIPSTTRAVFAFPQSEFIAVTAYANDKITQLKIANNPFAKGFRSEGNYGKRKLQDKSSDNNDSKKRRVSEEINVVDIDEEEAAETCERLHNASLNEDNKRNENSPVIQLVPSDMSSDDDVFETKYSTQREIKTDENTTRSQKSREALPEEDFCKQGVTIPLQRENLQPASSRVIRRLEERVTFRNSKTRTIDRPPKLVKIENRTPNAAIKILNNITNQSPNVEMCNECHRLRPQFYRPWESDSMCHCRQTHGNINNNTSEYRINIVENTKENRTSFDEPLQVKGNSEMRKQNTQNRPINALFNMSRILDTKNASPNRETIENIPQYVATSPVPFFYSSIYSNPISHRGNLCYFGKVPEPHLVQASYAYENERFPAHEEVNVNNNDDPEEEEVEALDFSIRDGEARARSPSDFSVSSSSSGYESRNSSSSELQSPPPSPQYNKYDDRYFSLPNISIVSSLF